MMNPKVPASSVVADMIALAEAIGTPANKRETLNLIAEQLNLVQEAVNNAGKALEEAKRIKADADALNANLVIRESDLASRSAAVAESHDSITRRQSQVAIKEAELAKAKKEYNKEVSETRNILEQREKTAANLIAKGEIIMAEAQNLKKEYENRLNRIKAATEG